MKLRTGKSFNILLPGKIYHVTLLVDHVEIRAEDLLKLSRHQLGTAVAILTGHASVQKYLKIMGLFGGGPNCRFGKLDTETVYHSSCCCEALARQRYNLFGKFFVEPKVISTASLKDLCLLVRDTGLTL
jgi:hypothetical protein